MYSFTETQKFRQWWLWLMLAVALLTAVGVPLYKMLHDGKGIHYVKFFFVLIFIPLFLAIKLETKIDGTGLRYRFFPIPGVGKQISWNDVAEAYVTEYAPLSDFGGWGIRYGFKRGWAYNIDGNMGLQLVLKSGKKILIGTQKPDELNSVLQSLIKDGIINVGGQTGA